MRSLTVLAALAIVALSHAAAAQDRAAAGQRPNVLLIITDDVGYGDYAPYGAPDVRTPTLDRLAGDGVKLTDFYAAPTCTPTRVSLITGRYQQRVGLERPLTSSGPRQDGLRPTGYSLPQLLKTNGYATGLVGKWHLGWRPEFGPNAHGFDYFYGFLSGYIDFYSHISPDGSHDLYENTTPVDDTGYMTDLITDRALRFIERNANQPFFLDVSYNAGHSPFQLPGQAGDHHGRSQHLQDDSTPPKRQEYAAILEHADASIGQILKKLDDLGLRDNTLVIFTNDNGGTEISRNAPLSNHKGSVWEGGIRVPAIARWPGRLPAGTVVNSPAIFMDLTTTILAATNTPAPAGAKLEGVNLLPLLQGTSKAPERTLFWRVPMQKAARQGDWKLLVDGDRLHLFDVRRDPAERTNVAAAHPELAQRLRALIAEWEAAVDAERKTITEAPAARSARQ